MFTKLKWVGICLWLACGAWSPLLAQSWSFNLPLGTTQLYDVVPASSLSYWVSARTSVDTAVLYKVSQTGQLQLSVSFVGSDRVALVSDSGDGLFVAYSSADGYDTKIDHYDAQLNVLDSWTLPFVFAKEHRLDKLGNGSIVLYSQVPGAPNGFLQLSIWNDSAPFDFYSSPFELFSDNEFRGFIPVAQDSFILVGGDADPASLNKYYAVGLHANYDTQFSYNVDWIQQYNDLGLNTDSPYWGTTHLKNNGKALYFAGNHASLHESNGAFITDLPIDGNIVAATDDSDSSSVFFIGNVNTFAQSNLVQFDNLGSIVAIQSITNLDPLSIEQWDKTHWLLSGRSVVDGNLVWQVRLLQNDLLPLSGKLSGNIWHDENLSCSFDADEAPLNERLVKAVRTSDNVAFFAISDTTGYYEMSLDTGEWLVLSFPINGYWGFCQDTQLVVINETNDTAVVDFATTVVLFCPQLNISLGSPLLRRCFNNNYYLHYENNGSVTAEDAHVDLEIDEYLSVVSASMAYTELADGKIRFELGDVAVGQSDDIHLVLYLDCDSTVIGQTHCVTATSFPDTICATPQLDWIGSKIEVDAECVGDTAVHFKISNRGSADMQSVRQFTIIEDLIIMMQAPFDINKGDSIQIIRPADGKTIRLRAPQELGYPEPSLPTIAVEGCGAETPEDIHLGFVLPFPEDNQPVSYEKLCMESIGSFDPNDKMGFPMGVGVNGYILPETPIDYQIRFQNTGTDTAFNVVVRDTLSQMLDINSLQLGARSHNYALSIEKDSILVFRFNNIMLPDSNINEPNSHGFFKFTIRHKAGLPLGSEIRNTAHIYFDFNEAVVTNTTLHTLAIDFLEVAEIENATSDLSQKRLRIFPQPSNRCVHMAWASGGPSTVAFYNALGVLSHTFETTNAYADVCKDVLNTGIYFVVVKQGNQTWNGRLVLTD